MPSHRSSDPSDSGFAMTSTRPSPALTGPFRENLDGMIELLSRGQKDSGEKRVGLELERILIDTDGRSVPYSGDRGVAALLDKLAESREEDECVHIDGRLFGFAYTFQTESERIGVTVSIEPASQLEVAVGPAKSTKALYEALLAFDRDVESALREARIQAELHAIGYNPTVSDPIELELIPKERYRDMDAYLSQRGRFARDMMRCSASTQVSLDYSSEGDAMRLCRAATILGPLLAFLFDNAPVFRGEPSPGMARSRIWRHMDTDRCGIVPGSLRGLTYEDYALWASNVKPILFTDAEHRTIATGDLYARDIMSTRILERGELAHLLSMVFPNVRLKGFCELREMDSLPPRLAAACAAFVSALFYDDSLEEKLAERLAQWLPAGFEDLDESDAVEARLELERLGWDASVYGVPVAEIVRVLCEVARENIENAVITGETDTHHGEIDPAACRRDESRADRAFDLEGIELLSSMWSQRKLPRDSNV